MYIGWQVHARHSIADAASPRMVPAREKSDWFGVDLRLEGTPLDSAQCIPASEVGQRACLCVVHRSGVCDTGSCCHGIIRVLCMVLHLPVLLMYQSIAKTSIAYHRLPL